jgi:hypothetical protein
VDLMFDVMTGFGLAAIAGILLYLHTALSHPPQERRRGRHVAEGGTPAKRIADSLAAARGRLVRNG